MAALSSEASDSKYLLKSRGLKNTENCNRRKKVMVYNHIGFGGLICIRIEKKSALPHYTLVKGKES